ncbi:MAG: hemolysin family protein [Akkermansiaceae bacterium]|nr:hemolysin family protein [Akkermansiaceae bacterium]MCF7733812.1 hemolysin family protein [Akkermansiaceae bacterium]
MSVFPAILATAPTEFLPVWQILLYLCGVVLFLLLNAFFVAAEFSIVKVRPSQVETAAKEKPRRSEATKQIITRLDPFLSACQLGITIASLALGFLGEPLVEGIVGPTLTKVFPGLLGFTILKVDLVSAISFTLAIASFTILHVIVGELIPKSIAISKPLDTSLGLARPLLAFSSGFAIPIRLMNGTANWILKTILRIEPVGEHGHAHSAKELAYLVEESERSQHVTETEREILEKALELNEVWVRDIMTHRSEVIFIDAAASFEDILELVRNTKHTRFPLVNDHLDDAIGFIHVKDLLSLVGQQKPNLAVIKRDLKLVPETMPLDILLKFFLKEKTSLALVADEFGHASGVVFLDNVIEELVGDIQDEFDNEHSAFSRLSDDEFITDGTTTLVDLADYDSNLYLESGEVTTVGGYITQQLGRFPEVGEAITILGWEAKVSSTDGRRVGQVQFRRLADPDDAAAANS